MSIKFRRGKEELSCLSGLNLCFLKFYPLLISYLAFKELLFFIIFEGVLPNSEFVRQTKGLIFIRFIWMNDQNS